jgi:RNA polymerase sigma-70 factor (ECF subfamily)
MIASTDFSSSANPALPLTDRVARATAASLQASLDIGLVHRFNDGDEAAFVEILTHYWEKMFSIAFSVLRNRADAEEVAQDTFVRAHRALGGFRGDASLATWLHRIALNLSRNRYWYLFRRRQHLMQSFDTPVSDDNSATLGSLIASDTPSPVQEAATNEFSELVAECMTRLGAGHQAILAQRYTLNCSYDEISRAFGISIGTVKSRIARARASLRVLLAKACPEFAPDASPGEWFDPNRPSGLLETICA